jgi:hypothetical protein
MVAPSPHNVNKKEKRRSKRKRKTTPTEKKKTQPDSASASARAALSSLAPPRFDDLAQSPPVTRPTCLSVLRHHSSQADSARTSDRAADLARTSVGASGGSLLPASPSAPPPARLRRRSRFPRCSNYSASFTAGQNKFLNA